MLGVGEFTRFVLLNTLVAVSPAIGLAQQSGDVGVAHFSGWLADSTHSRMTDLWTMGLRGTAIEERRGRVAALAAVCSEGKAQFLLKVDFRLRRARSGGPYLTEAQHRFDREPAVAKEWIVDRDGQTAMPVDVDRDTWLDRVASADTTLIELRSEGGGGALVFSFPGEGLAERLQWLRGYCTSRTP